MNKLLKNTGIILVLFIVFNIYGIILNTVTIDYVGVILNITWALFVSTCAYLLAEISLRCINYK